MGLDAFLFEGADELLAKAVLLRCVRDDIILSKTVAAHDADVLPGTIDEAVIVSQPQRGTGAFHWR